MPHWDDPEFQQIVCPTIDIGGFAGRQVEGFLDVAHFGFVHTETFGDRANTRVPSYVPETNDVGFTVDYWSSVANYPVGSMAKSPEGFEWLRHFEVHLPFTASITVHFPDNGRLVVMNCASPVSSRMTRLFAPIARNFDKHIPVEAVHEFNRQVFEEDRRVVEAQKPEFLPRSGDGGSYSRRQKFVCLSQGTAGDGLQSFFCGVKSFDDVWPMGIRNSPLCWVRFQCSMIRRLKKSIF